VVENRPKIRTYGIPNSGVNTTEHGPQAEPTRQALRKLPTALLFIVVAHLSFMVYQAERVPQWRYVILAPRDVDFEAVMNKAGGQGYELVFVPRASVRALLGPKPRQRL
jgi:hypothetical protein